MLHMRLDHGAAACTVFGTRQVQQHLQGIPGWWERLRCFLGLAGSAALQSCPPTAAAGVTTSAIAEQTKIADIGEPAPDTLVAKEADLTGLCKLWQM